MSEKERKFKSFDECRKTIEKHITGRYEDSSVLLLKDVLEFLKSLKTYYTHAGLATHEVIDAISGSGYSKAETAEILKESGVLANAIHSEEC